MLQHDRTTCMVWDPELCWLSVWCSQGLLHSFIHYAYIHMHFCNTGIALSNACHAMLEISRLQMDMSQWCNAALIPESL